MFLWAAVIPLWLLFEHSNYIKPSLPCPRTTQRAKKVVSDSPGLVDFAIGLVNSVFNLPNGQVMFSEIFE